MSDLCRLIWSAVFALFRSRAALHAEILFLRHQLNVLHRRSPKRVALSNIDRLVFVVSSISYSRRRSSTDGRCSDSCAAGSEVCCLTSSLTSKGGVALIFRQT